MTLEKPQNKIDIKEDYLLKKDDLLVKYAMHNISSQLFVNKYQLYLPNKEELQHLIESQLS